jgi:hypothetical protein
MAPERRTSVRDVAVSHATLRNGAHADPDVGAAPPPAEVLADLTPSPRADSGSRSHPRARVRGPSAFASICSRKAIVLLPAHSPLRSLDSTAQAMGQAAGPSERPPAPQCHRRVPRVDQEDRSHPGGVLVRFGQKVGKINRMRSNVTMGSWCSRTPSRDDVTDKSPGVAR